MGIPVEKKFVIEAARGEVWAFLTDPSRVAGCLPGAAITERVDERTHAGTIAVKVGPVSARYKGTVRFERLDEDGGVAEIAAAGQDVRGKGGADMRMTSRVVARGPGETEVTVSSTVNITGILAQFGRGMIQDVSDEMFRRFTDAMRAALEPASDGKGSDSPAGDRPDAAGRAAASADAASPAAEGGDATSPAAEGGDATSPAAEGGDATSPAAEAADVTSSAGAVVGATAGPEADRQDARARGAAPSGAAPQGPASAGSAPGSEPIDAVSLGATVGGRALGRLVRRPGFWLAVIAAVILWLIVR